MYKTNTTWVVLSGIQHTIRPYLRGYATNTKVPSNRNRIGTLDPECLRGSDFLDLSNRKVKRIYAELKNGQVITGLDIRYFTKTEIYRFPEMTAGFLYCHRDPRLPPRTGEIRFRVTNSADPASFQSGFDLLRHDGELPWSIPLVLSKSPLRELAIQDGLLDPIIPDPPTRWWRNPFLAFLEQPFTLNVENETTMIALLDPQSCVNMVPLYSLFRHCPSKGEFEMSRLHFDI